METKENSILHQRVHLSKKSRFFFERIVQLTMVIFILLIVASITGYNSRMNEAKRNLKIFTENQASSFTADLDGNLDRILVISSLEGLKSKDYNEQKKAYESVQDFLAFDRVYLVNQDGDETYFDNENHPKHTDEVLCEDIQQFRLYVSDPYEYNGERVITMSSHILDDEGDVLNILCADFSLDTLDYVITTTTHLYNGHFYVMNNVGDFIASSQKERVMNNENFSSLANNHDFDELFESQESVYGNLIIGNDGYLAYGQYIESYDWYIVECMAYDALGRQLIVTLVLEVLLGVLMVTMAYGVRTIIKQVYETELHMYYDALTGVQNRASFSSLCDSVEQCYDRRLNVLYFDLNGFKGINDTYGHDKGDILLKVFAATLSNIFDELGFVGRLGGDEFIVMLMDKSDDELEKLIVELNQQLAKIDCDLEGYKLSASSGFASREVGEERSISKIISEADNKMYENKMKSRTNN